MASTVADAEKHRFKKEEKREREIEREWNCRVRKWKLECLSQGKIPGNIQKSVRKESIGWTRFSKKNELVLWTGLLLLGSFD